MRRAALLVASWRRKPRHRAGPRIGLTEAIIDWFTRPVEMPPWAWMSTADDPSTFQDETREPDGTPDR